MAALEDRIRRLEDRAALQDLVATYFLATDDDDLETLAACFTPYASFAANGFEGAVGREAVLAFLKAARAGMGQTVHSPDYCHLTFENQDEAAGVITAHIELGLGEETCVGAVRYLDRYRRHEGCWRIARREMKVVHVGPWRDIASSLTSRLNVRWPGAPAQPSDFPRPGKSRE